MFQIVRTIIRKCHLVMAFFVSISAFIIFPNINPTFSNTDNVKNHINKTNQSHIKLETNIAPTPKPDLILLLGGDLVEMEGPLIRPSIEDVLPVSASTLGGLLAKEANLFIKSEKSLALNKNETLADILKRANFSSNDLYQIAEIVSKKINVRKLGIGMNFIVGFDDYNQPVALKLNQSEKLDYFIFKNELGSWKGLQAIRPIDSEFIHASGIINVTLYEAAVASEVPLPALDTFMRVMGFSVDFQRQLQEGDEFELVYKKTTDRITGETLSVGDVHYVGMVLSGKPIGYYRHKNNNGSIGWYDKNGKSAVRTLMRTPVNGARLSSSYGMRKHPKTGKKTFHHGIDLAGTWQENVRSTAPGTVVFAGHEGSFGKVVRIEHDFGISTLYAHLSRITVRVGNYVAENTVIGKMGNTGRSAGSHLHYEIQVDGKSVDPSDFFTIGRQMSVSGELRQTSFTN